jgi:hypothetical protein
MMAGAQQWGTLKIEGLQRLGSGQPPGFGLSGSGGEVTQIDQRHREIQGRRDQLQRLSIDDPERCPQYFVALDDRDQAPVQRGTVETAAHSHGHCGVIGRTLRLKLIEKPEPLLGKGYRKGEELFFCRRRRVDRLRWGGSKLLYHPALLSLSERPESWEIVDAFTRRDSRATGMISGTA